MRGKTRFSGRVNDPCFYGMMKLMTGRGFDITEEIYS
jgi:hypothetical protein